MSYKAVDSFFPQWNIWMEFLECTIATLRLDSMAGSHPIEVEIHHTNEIDEIFYDIIYIKGASILRMLESYLGAKRFQKALASYIKKYAYSNAKTEDLCAVLEEETGEPLKDLMTPWTKQSGYPVINVKHEGTHIQLEQTQFVLDGSSRDGLWDVPITLRCASSTKKFLLKYKYAKLDVCGKREKDGNIWIKLNINETGFYRVKYDKEIAATLQNALEAKEFSSTDKIGIVENSLVLSMSLKDTLASLLHILYACREEANYTVLTHINDITAVVAKISIDATPNLAGDIKQLLIKILLSHAVKLGWDPKDSEDDLDAAYLSVMQKVSSSNRSGYDALRQVYKDTTDGEEKLRVLGVLSSCPDKDIVLETLNLIFTNEENWDHILKVVPESDLLWSIVNNIVPLFTSNDKAEEISKFLTNYTEPTLGRALKGNLEMVRINMRWIDGIRSEPRLAQTVHELLHKP